MSVLGKAVALDRFAPFKRVIIFGTSSGHRATSVVWVRGGSRLS